MDFNTTPQRLVVLRRAEVEDDFAVTDSWPVDAFGFTTVGDSHLAPNGDLYVIAGVDGTPVGKERIYRAPLLR